MQGTVRAGRWSPILSAYAAFIASKSAMSARNTFTCTTWPRSEPTAASMVAKESSIFVVWVPTSGPAGCPVAGSTPATPPMVTSEPTFATWL